MTRLFTYLAAGAAALAVAVPAAAQSPYQYPYPQQGYPQGQYYPQQQQGNVISQMINQLLGNRYQANDRLAVERCATAAVAEANARYRTGAYGQGYYGQQGYGHPNPGYGYGNQGYHPQMAMRVTAITEVQRRQSGLRVSGLLDSQGGYHAYGQQPYGNAYGYQGQRHAAQGDLTFRCNIDHRGAVTNVRVRHNQTAYRQGY